MEGLHIFSQSDIVALPSWYVGALVGLGILFGLPSGLLMENCKRKIVKVIAGVVFVITMTCVMVFGLCWVEFQQPTGKYEYTVSIDDSEISLIEFNSKYEIVRQEGELWIIRDK